MNSIQKFVLSNLFLKQLLFKKHYPFIVSWAVTERCNLCCIYCGIKSDSALELSTGQVLDIISTLYTKGIRIIHLTGGEPLLREDISEIISYCIKKGIYATLATNGILVPERINAVKKISSINISLEGSENIHDSIRGQGTHNKALRAIALVKEHKIPFSISATLNAMNLNSLDYLLNTAKIFKTKIFFQPATQNILYTNKPNPIAPETSQYKKAVSYLIKNKNRFIGNSVSGLKHLFFWPSEKHICCFAGRFFIRLDSAGNISPCSRSVNTNVEIINAAEGSNKYVLRNNILGCGQCWCSSLVELNLILKLDIRTLLNAVNL